jgi:hypothetical protein
MPATGRWWRRGAEVGADGLDAGLQVGAGPGLAAGAGARGGQVVEDEGAPVPGGQPPGVRSPAHVDPHSADRFGDLDVQVWVELAAGQRAGLLKATETDRSRRPFCRASPAAVRRAPGGPDLTAAGNGKTGGVP